MVQVLRSTRVLQHQVIISQSFGNKNQHTFAFSDGIDIPGAVETVGTATTFTQSADKVILSLDAQTGTVFEHNIATNGSVGIVSLTNFPSAAVKSNSLTTFTVIFTCDAALQGLGNTTAATGIGTNIVLFLIMEYQLLIPQQKLHADAGLHPLFQMVMIQVLREM